MPSKLVSIAMATYNGEKFINEQLHSIINQTYSSIEIVICDDKSTDKTIEIIKNFMKKDSRIRLYENIKNLGYIKNFEKAISLCKGYFIALSDQDDIWLFNKISILEKEIQHYLLIHSDAYLINEHSVIISPSYTQKSRKMINPKSIIDMLLNGSVTGCTCMFSQKIIKHILPFPEGIDIHDKWLGVNAYYFGKIKYLKKPLIKYRQHSDNLIGAGLQNNKNGAIPLKIEKLLSYKNKELCLYERKQLLLISVYRHYFFKKFNYSDTIKIRLLVIYYNNVINSFLPIKAFLIRMLLFPNFERNKSFSYKLYSLLLIFKKSFLFIVSIVKNMTKNKV